MKNQKDFNTSVEERIHNLQQEKYKSTKETHLPILGIISILGPVLGNVVPYLIWVMLDKPWAFGVIAFPLAIAGFLSGILASFFSIFIVKEKNIIFALIGFIISLVVILPLIK